MTDPALHILLWTALTVGFVHTLVGVDHTLPFIVLGRARRWSLRKTLGVTALCGLGHVATSVALGAVGIAAGVALDAMARNPERELAFPTRTVVYLAGGLPVIHHHYDELGEIIDRAGAGWVVDPEDDKGIGELLRGILRGELDVDGPAQSALDLVRRELPWDLTIGPLAEFCRQPVFREGKTASRLRFEEQHRRLGRLEAELAETRRGLNTLRGKRWVRWGLGLTSARAWMRWPMALLASLIGLALIPVFLVNDWIGRLGSRR